MVVTFSLLNTYTLHAVLTVSGRQLNFQVRGEGGRGQTEEGDGEEEDDIEEEEEEEEEGERE